MKTLVANFANLNEDLIIEEKNILQTVTAQHENMEAYYANVIYKEGKEPDEFAQKIISYVLRFNMTILSSITGQEINFSAKHPNLEYKLDDGLDNQESQLRLLQTDNSHYDILYDAEIAKTPDFVIILEEPEIPEKMLKLTCCKATCCEAICCKGNVQISSKDIKVRLEQEAPENLFQFCIFFC